MLLVESFPPALGPSFLPSTLGSTISGADPERLLDILQPQRNLALWHRALLPDFVQSLAPLVAAAPFTALAEGVPEELAGTIAQHLPAPPPLALLADIQQLAVIFCAVAGVPTARLRLEGITGRACHRWHADAVGLRLLTTYQGAGTQWLPLGGGAATARGLEPSALPCRPQSIPSGSVAILKGEGHPGNAGWGCIHRSPPAGRGSRARLLLCIDEPGRIPCA